MHDLQQCCSQVGFQQGRDHQHPHKAISVLFACLTHYVPRSIPGVRGNIQILCYWNSLSISFFLYLFLSLYSLFSSCFLFSLYLVHHASTLFSFSIQFYTTSFHRSNNLKPSAYVYTLLRYVAVSATHSFISVYLLYIQT